MQKTEWFTSDKSQKEYQCSFYELDGEEILHGIERFWYEDGVLEGEMNYENGQQHGRSYWYFPDGSLMWETEYNQGSLIHGKFYRREQKLISEIRDGIGVWVEHDFSEPSAIIYYAEYADGLLNGKELNFHPDGEVYLERIWERGICVDEVSHDEPIVKGVFTQGFDLLKTWFGRKA